MRKIITTTFVSMDGVMQGVADAEDPSDKFTQDRWWADYNDDMTGKVIDGFMSRPFELLLGRKSYDIWAAYWPSDKDAPPSIGKPLNAAKKYVVSHENKKLDWHNSVVVTGDVVSEIKKLKELDAPDLWVWGSSQLIQTLLKADLIDEMHIWIHPLTVGVGKRLLQEGIMPATFQLADSQVSSTGVIIAHYVRTEK